ncbi:IPT/TIG domain-containing protein [Aquiflexum gelatinilyticum]|uniref:IPT/TIG domain-containing protein n=1 Tax=Aquiflexum gelatinilyticum TaxID=2961943 RepID=UPI002166DB64|nr:IPT/TIG domain-containing protein [Aquiflexum gelatinilyticum]MCS4434897.1 IPT/TIG domain-containing protein [Aquiflexum gelatinilyticum]
MDRSKFGLISLLLIFFGIFSSCEEESQVTTSLITEEVIYLSGERARVLGRIITNQNVAASDHGFYISENESFSQPIIISLGERVAPGRFIGETSELDIQKKYFVKSFISLPDGIQFGNVLEITTLSPDAFSFSPLNGPVGTTVTIKGKNFTADTKVFFGNRQAQILKIDFESLITAIVPGSGTIALEEVRVIVQNQEILLEEKFEYTTGKFTQLPNFPSSLKLFDNVSFQNGLEFFAGLGANNGQTINSQFWKYSLVTGNWTQVDFQGDPLWRAFNSSNYFGGGALVISQNSLSSPSTDFWKYENNNFIKLPPLPFTAVNSLSFELNNKLFVMGGAVGFGTDVYRFNISTGQWQKIANSPFAVNRTVLNFSYDNKQYLVDPVTKEIYAFDGDLETWSFYGIYPGDINSGSAFGVTIGDRVITGMANRSQEVWELNLSNGLWVRKNIFPGNPIARNVGVYVHDNLIYILRSAEVQLAVPMEFWVFDPFGL